MVMENSCLMTNPDNIMTHKFDLKGSVLNRSSLSKQEMKLLHTKFRNISKKYVLKDNDLKFVLKKHNPELINISYGDKIKLLK